MSMLETLLKSVEEKSIVRYRKQTLDHYSASAIIAVWKALSRHELKVKYEEVIEKDVIKAASIAFKLCK